eukprot:TRINITY_DN1085_c0_g1_i1.p1 TRINITY_DN1085_c0_g1~~TRINITY_DN1085_c0_g1_i1.p1  ORF type:complete len:410 (-),score=100.37 TRINITY_DN1085_c0_g1_i1:1299-2528(-)
MSITEASRRRSSNAGLGNSSPIEPPPTKEGKSGLADLKSTVTDFISGVQNKASSVSTIVNDTVKDDPPKTPQEAASTAVTVLTRIMREVPLFAHVLAVPLVFARAARLLFRHPSLLLMSLIPAGIALLVSVVSASAMYMAVHYAYTKLFHDMPSGSWYYLWLIGKWVGPSVAGIGFVAAIPWMTLIAGMPLAKPLARQADRYLSRDSADLETDETLQKVTGSRRNSVASEGAEDAAEAAAVARDEEEDKNLETGSPKTKAQSALRHLMQPITHLKNKSDIIDAVVSSVALHAAGGSGALMLVLLSFIPGLAALTGPFSTLVWTPLFVALDVMRHALARRGLSFRESVAVLIRHPLLSLPIGLVGAPLITIPVLNIIGLPLAVIAGVVAVHHLEAVGAIDRVSSARAKAE